MIISQNVFVANAMSDRTQQCQFLNPGVQVGCDCVGSGCSIISGLHNTNNKIQPDISALVQKTDCWAANCNTIYYRFTRNVDLLAAINKPYLTVIADSTDLTPWTFLTASIVLAHSASVSTVPVRATMPSVVST